MSTEFVRDFIGKAEEVEDVTKVEKQLTDLLNGGVIQQQYSLTLQKSYLEKLIELLHLQHMTLLTKVKSFKLLRINIIHGLKEKD